jgi:hypothetical protein
MRIPSNQPVRSTVGDANTTVKCEPTSCTNTGIVSFLLGGAIVGFFAFQAGTMFGGSEVYKATKR